MLVGMLVLQLRDVNIRGMGGVMVGVWSVLIAVIRGEDILLVCIGVMGERD